MILSEESRLKGFGAWTRPGLPGVTERPEWCGLAVHPGFGEGRLTRLISGRPRHCWRRWGNATPADRLLLPYHDGCVCSNLLSISTFMGYLPEIFKSIGRVRCCFDVNDAHI